MVLKVDPSETDKLITKRDNNWYETIENDQAKSSDDRKLDQVSSPIVEPLSNILPNGPIAAVSESTLFQRMVIVSLIRLVVYLNKLYQDLGAIYEYKDNHDYKYFAVSIVSFIGPSILYTLFRIEAEMSKINGVLGTKKLLTITFNGMLMIPWQIKRYLDLLHFCSGPRVCNWRLPTEWENHKIDQLQRDAEFLEFFEDFYAGFLQILLQLYIGLVDWMDSQKLEIKPLYGVFLGSISSVISLMFAVRRRDDGKLTGFLSFFGWLSFITSRVSVFALITTLIHSWVVLLCLIHALLFTIWIYNTAIESYGISNCRCSSYRKLLTMVVFVFLYFGIPSLLIWPMMFQLKENHRPYTFLAVCTVENVALLGFWLIWQSIYNQDFHLSDSATLTLIIVIVGANFVGDLLLLLYVFCKPQLTDKVVLYEIQTDNTEDDSNKGGLKYGIFYEFFDIVFKLPPTDEIGPKLQRYCTSNALRVQK